MKLPAPLARLIDLLTRLPGIGPKTAARLSFYLWQTPGHFRQNLAQAILELGERMQECSLCFNLDETNPCRICTDPNRDKTIVCVVERPLDVLAIERLGRYQGLYHILGGVINPLARVRPEDLKIAPLLTRLREHPEIKEVILALNPTLEGEITLDYIKKEIKQAGLAVRLTRLGLGLPTGADLDYADNLTLARALDGRVEVK